MKLADAFGGGMGHMGLTCGAVTGACMVIGLRHGRTAAGDNEAKRITSLLVKRLAEEFQERNRTMVCKELMGCDVGTPEGRCMPRSTTSEIPSAPGSLPMPPGFWTTYSPGNSGRLRRTFIFPPQTRNTGRPESGEKQGCRSAFIDRQE